MSRTMSAAAVRGLFAQASNVVFLDLLTIAAEGVDPVRVVDNVRGIISDGVYYEGFPFELTLPPDVSERLGTLQLKISNVDRRLVEAIRAAPPPIMVTLQTVTAQTPDIVEYGPLECELFDVDANIETITGTLGFEPVLYQPFPYGKFDPQRFPGVHGRAATA